MSMPTPDDPGAAPVWENYVVAQACQASLGLIPRSALAVGVRVDGLEVTLLFQLRGLTDADVADMQDIAEELEMLLGDRVRVESTHEIREARSPSPFEGTRWIFLSRD